MKLLLQISFLLIAKFGCTQDPIYHHYTTSNGLSSSEVYDIIQDDWGYIWFSTDNGLTRYDGYTFKHYSTNDGLTNNTVFSFFKDREGKIWCTTFEPSVFQIVGEIPQFIPYHRNDIFNTLDPANVLNKIYFDSLNIPDFTFLNAHGSLSVNKQGKLIDNLIKLEGNQALRSSPDIIKETIIFNSPPGAKESIEKLINEGFLNAHKIGSCRVGAVSFNEESVFVMVNDSVFCYKNGGESTLFHGSELLGIKKLDANHVSILTRSNGVFI